MMLRPVVIGDDGIHRIRVRRVAFFNYQHSTLNSQPGMLIAQGWEILKMKGLKPSAFVSRRSPARAKILQNAGPVHGHSA
jgi:hypothetical protein